MRHAVVMAALLVSGLAVGSTPYETFKLASIKGTVEAQGSRSTEFQPATKGQTFGFGVTLRTGDESTVRVELSAENTFEIGPNSTVKIVKGLMPDRAHTVRLNLDMGHVDVKLSNYPADQGFQVSNPLGIYTAVGTDFDVLFEELPNGSTRTTMNVAQGEVGYDSLSATTPSVVAGGSLSITMSEGMVSRVLEITVTGTQPVIISIGGVHEIRIEPGSTIRVAMETTDGQPNFVAVDVLSGQAAVGDTTLGASDPPNFISGQTVLNQPGADVFMSAAITESTTSEEISEGGLTPEELAALQAQQQAAADQLQAVAPASLPSTSRSPYVPISLNDPPQTPIGGP